jgi:hypothetical protein
MQDEVLEQAIELLEKANGELEPELMTVAEARARLALYLRLQETLAVGRAALAKAGGDEA